MKRNIIRLVVVGMLATAWLLYLHWNRQQIERSPKRHQIDCVNNLDQIGLAFRIWNGDHGGKYPFNVSTNAGGTLELCAPDKDGFDNNAYLHLQTLANELNSPKILICPLDHSKRPAANWASLTVENITYRFRSGTNVAIVSPNKILAICPIDGNVLFSDGTVVRAKQTGDEEPDRAMHLHMK